MILFHSYKSEWSRDQGTQPPCEKVGKPPGNRRGTLLAEVGIATVVLMIVMGMTVKVLSTVAHERRAARNASGACSKSANLMERITALPFDQVTPGSHANGGLGSRLDDRFVTASWRST